MDPGEVLNRGRAAALAGRYEEALRDLVWFHEHALEHDKAYYGVRLSFAICYWKELADVYEPAQQAMAAARAHAQRELLAGRGGRDEFHDVVAIDRELKRPADTYELFVWLRKTQAALAEKCADLAVKAVVDVGDYELASRLLPSPELYLLWLSDQLNVNWAEERATPRLARRRRDAYVRNYCADVRVALRILKGLGNESSARAAIDWAIALVTPRRARAMVCADLVR